MSIVEANVTCWLDVFEFHRRASRSEHWWFWLTYVVFLNNQWVGALVFLGIVLG